MKFFNALFFLGMMYALIISNSFQLRSQKFTFVKINSVMTGDLMENGLQLAFNAVPAAVGIYLLKSQDESLKDKLAAQEKFQKDALLAQDKSLKDALVAQDKSQKESLTALKDALLGQDKSLKDALVGQDKSQKDALAGLKDTLAGQDKCQKESLTALEKLFRDNLTAEKLLWSERFDNFLRRSNLTTS
jgi:hypothetical protein